jgi:hypothetical protein
MCFAGTKVQPVKLALLVPNSNNDDELALIFFSALSHDALQRMHRQLQQAQTYADLCLRSPVLGADVSSTIW